MLVRKGLFNVGIFILSLTFFIGLPSNSAEAQNKCVNDVGNASNYRKATKKFFEYLVCIHNTQHRRLNDHDERIRGNQKRLNSHSEAINDHSRALNNHSEIIEAVRTLVLKQTNEIQALQRQVFALQGRIGALENN